jgi:hypothetical protein
MKVTNEMVAAAMNAFNDNPVTGISEYFTSDMQRAIEAAIQAAWVSIDDELPIRGSQVLILSNELPVIGYRNSDDTLRVFGTHKLIINATHWMPLPEHKV